MRHAASVVHLRGRAPARIDFGGGWTDVPPYPEREGGYVCNLAIARYATATLSASVDSELPHDPLVRAALRRSGLPHLTASLTSDFPVGAGLGGSSAAGVALAGVLNAVGEKFVDRTTLAQQSRATEVEELGVAGGYQDHFAAAYGGALLLHFSGTGANVDQLPLSDIFTSALERRGILIHTGESRISANTITAVLNGYLGGRRRVTGALARMKELARQMASAILQSDLDLLAGLVGEHWTHQRSLHAAITTPRIDQIMSVAARSGALGGKALGASGGGCVFAIARDGRESDLVSALAPFGERLAFRIDTNGFTLL